LKVWGYSTHINLSRCNEHRIRSIEGTKNFLKDLVYFIKMTPYGEPQVIHFGKKEDVAGISGNIFLEESNICLHLVEVDNSAFIDIFSCKPYSAEVAYSYCEKYFQSESGNYSYLTRGI